MGNLFNRWWVDNLTSLVSFLTMMVRAARLRRALRPHTFCKGNPDNDGGGLMRGGSVEVLGFGEELMIKIALYSKSSHNVVDRFCNFKQNDI